MARKCAASHVIRGLAAALIGLPAPALAQAGSPGPGASDVRAYGAKCDGVTDDSGAFSAAFAALSSRGGMLQVPATGNGCVLNTGQTIPKGTTLQGLGPSTYPLNNSIALTDYTASGSWIICKDRVNPCMSMLNSGEAIRNLNFIYVQPVPPSSGSWTPRAYPYTILMEPANYDLIDGVSIVAATHCIDIEGPPDGSGRAGFNTTLRDIRFNGCFDVGTKFNQIDNTLTLDDLKYDDYWNEGNDAVINYMESNKIDWLISYLANPQATNIEFYLSKIAISISTGTVKSGFGTVSFGVNDMQGANISFNEVCQAIVSGPSVVNVGTLSNVIVYGDTHTNCFRRSEYMFDFSGNAGNWTMNNVLVGYVATLAAVGNASILRINGLDVQQYGNGAPGAAAFAVSSAAQVSLANSPANAIHPGSGGGPVYGPGLDGSQGVATPTASGGTGVGFTQLENGDAGHAGDIAFYDASGARRGFMGRSSPTSPVLVQSDSGGVTLNGASATAPVSVGRGVLGIPMVTWSAKQPCAPGQISVDASYIYVCTSLNTVKRVALSAF
jgi:hypothetical protein